ncbi:MAG: isochorismatase family protein [Methylophilaceae bacterium]
MTIADANQSQLVIIDIQTKLCNVMQAEAMHAVIKNTGILLQAANMLEIPTVATEQYPQVLGETTPDVSQYFGGIKPIAKTAFSAAADPKFKAHCQRDKSHIILVGMETHICVLQTALALAPQGKQVFVVEDAVISRNANNKANAIARMRDAGCIITNTESVLFEWLGNAQHEAFKTLSKLIK